MRMLIDDVDYGIDSNVEGDIIIEHRRFDNEGNQTKSFAETITLFGNAFVYIKELFIDNPNGKFETASITLIDDCCGDDRVVFEGILLGENVDWCEGDCTIKVTAVEFSEDIQKLDCVRSTLITDNHDGFQQQQHPRMVYCTEYRPSVLQDIVLIFGIILNLNLLLLSPLIAAISTIVITINLIINVVNTLPGVNITPISFAGNQGVLGQIGNLITSLNSLIIGCGRRHPSPLVRSYINNVCNKCGLQFESSIFTQQSSDYYNTVLYNAPIEKGKRPLTNINGETPTWVPENAPIETLESFLDKLKIVFNAQWDVKDGVLRFERKDFFYQNQDFVSYEDLKVDNRIDGVICYSWRGDEAPAILRLKYAEDAVDWVGNEASPRFNEIIEWNVPFNARQKGMREVVFPFGVARYRDDGIDRDVIGDYNFFPLYTQAINSHDGVLIQNNGTSFQPKLLIWDGQSINFGKVKKYNIQGYTIPFVQNYNYPYSGTSFGSLPQTAYSSDVINSAIYKRFFSIDDPRVLGDQGKTFTFAFKFNCEEIQGFDLSLNVLTPIGSGRMKSATVNYTKRTMEIQGDV